MMARSSAGLQAGLDVDLDAALREDVDGARGQLVGDETLGIGMMPPRGDRVRRQRRPSACGAERLQRCSSADRPKAQSSQGSSASRSAVSTVAPHQMRRPGGASR